MADRRILIFLALAALSVDAVYSNQNYLLGAPKFYQNPRSAPSVLEDTSWQGFSDLGQVSGVAVDGDGNLHIFHRGDRIWHAGTFDHRYHLTDISQGPIPNDTVLIVDPVSQKVIFSWGSNRFYMPHGLTVDRDGNSWVTDVGLHQVFKFPARENEPELVLGKAFTPGSDRNHFCQPSDVAVAPQGFFFVSDGYCNSRLLMFSRAGNLLKIIGTKDGMVIPHSLTLVPEYDAVCVADRENSRILCYSSGSDGKDPGQPLASIEGQGLGRVFAIDTRGRQMFVVNGPDLWKGSQSISSDRGLVIDMDSGTLQTMWGPDPGFLFPHDLEVSPDGKNVYVSEIDLSAPKRVYKFDIKD